MRKLSHLDDQGKPKMVDATSKAVTSRQAAAEGWVVLKQAHREALQALPKGDALGVAEIAGVLAGKRCAELIPLCHPLPLSFLQVRIRLEDRGLRIEASARATAQTGVEMEAYTAVAIAGVTLIDMLKGVDPDLTITDIRLLSKTGGKKDWKRPSAS